MTNHWCRGNGVLVGTSGTVVGTGGKEVSSIGNNDAEVSADHLGHGAVVAARRGQVGAVAAQTIEDDKSPVWRELPGRGTGGGKGHRVGTGGEEVADRWGHRWPGGCAEVAKLRSVLNLGIG